MSGLTHSAFEIVSFQATVFTPDEDLSASRILREFYPKQAGLFDSDPVVLPPISGAPGEVPRIVLQGKTAVWRCEIAPARVNLFCRKQSDEDALPDPAGFFSQASALLCDYKETLQVRIGRIAALLSRAAKSDNPGIALARHFCKDKWDQAPLNRPESFELHAHKRFLMDDTFQVNSWARSKTGYLTSKDAKSPIVLFEQDLNTLSEEVSEKSLEKASIAHFFRAVASEFETILKLYYPST